MGAAEASLIFVAGVLAGTINTVVGSGTLVTFPTLLAIGYPSVLANVSNTVGLVPGSVSGAIGYRRELAAIDDPDEREAAFQAMVDAAYEHGKALNSASHFEIDDVIDPADSRRWITTLLTDAPRPPRPAGKKRPVVDTW